MPTNKQGANALWCGNIKATIWKNATEKGPFFATTFSAHSRISLEYGAMGLRSVSMTSKPLSPWRVTPRSGLQLIP